MAKYETTIKISARERVPDLLTILEGLFYRKPELGKKALQFIYQIIELGGIPDKDWEKTMSSLQMTHQEYYTMLNKLRDAGMISKQNGTWVISRQFGNRMREMADIWGSFVRRWSVVRRSSQGDDTD